MHYLQNLQDYLQDHAARPYEQRVYMNRYVYGDATTECTNLRIAHTGSTRCITHGNSFT